MIRSTRLRRVPLRYSKEENVVEPILKKVYKKKVDSSYDAITENKDTTTNERQTMETRSDVPAKLKSAKGNFYVGKRYLSASESPVLRDRTNLIEEHLKVDLLMKKGTGGKSTAGKKTVDKTTKKEDEKDKPLVVKTSSRQAKPTTLQLAKGKSPKTKKMIVKSSVSKSKDEIDDADAGKSEEREAVTKKLSARAGSKRNSKNDAGSDKKTTGKTSLTKNLDESDDNQKKKSLQPSTEVKVKRTSLTNPDHTKKFFKTKALRGNDDKITRPIKKIVSTKARKLGIAEKPRMSTSFRLRQTTLKESFLKQAAKKTLRPRKMLKNYCEDTLISSKENIEDETKNVERKTGPVYKSVKLTEKPIKDTNEIYEFDFDSNDSREKIPKKTRKKRVVRKVPKKRIQQAVQVHKVESTATSEKENEIVGKLNTNEVQEMNLEVPLATNDDVPVVDEIKSVNPAVIDDKKESANNINKEPKPVVIESIALTGQNRISLTATPQPTKSGKPDFRPFRTTNAFNNARTSIQYKTMLKHALLNKSLSPISKAVENFDPASPWRQPEFKNLQFSRVKNVVQSTPHVRNFTNMLEKVPSGKDFSVISASSISPVKMNKIHTPPRNTTVSPRKFGTVMSNINTNVVKQNNGTSDENLGSPRKVTINEIAHSQDSEIIDRQTLANLEDFEDGAENKENVETILPSPKKSPIKVYKKLDTKGNPLRMIRKMKLETKENFEPQPGPSGLQKRSPLGESRILKQSNLNNFLNIEEMPKSTTISTIHGIFDDAHSTPINGRPMKKMIKDANIENAFGFDDYSDIDVSPIKTLQLSSTTGQVLKKPLAMAQKNDENKIASVAPARLSIAEIKKNLLPIITKPKGIIKNPIERVGQQNNEYQTVKHKKLSPKKQEAVDSGTFSDTFDILSEENKQQEDSQVEIPLFADLEPGHFKQPPRYSYKRKRAVKFSFSDEEDENAVAEEEHHEKKKRKTTKVDKQREKQLDDWAKNLNQTFEEIEDFPLVVEKK